MLRYSDANRETRVRIKSLRSAPAIEKATRKIDQYASRVIVKNRVLTFLNDESGATAIEYGLIAAGIALAIITVTKGLGTKLNSTFTSISSSLK